MHDVALRTRNRPLGGFMLLTVRARPGLALEGEYWTDRDTKGELRFTARTNRMLDGFDAAAAERYE
jgi:hypothetical protein